MFFSLLRLISILLAIIAITFLLPIGVALYYNEFFAVTAFTIPLVAVLVVAGIILWVTKNTVFKLTARTGFLAVALSWVLASVLGAIPLMLSGCISSFSNAFFESVSGFTTTGATILSEITTLPRSINLWRTQTHWLGGMGIVALTVALMPLLGVGGFQLIKAETTGPEKYKITPKITVMAKILWFIYLGFTLLQTILLMWAGMDFVDALSHTFATLGTGGFSSQNASVGAYNSWQIDLICTLFMGFAAVNFSLYYRLFINQGKDIINNTEFRVYVGILVVATLFVAFNISPLYGSFLNALRYASFQVTSIMTTTGFATADYTQWPYFSQMILFILMFIGGSSGSTAGSIKVIRWVILGKQLGIEVKRLLHPHGVFSIQLNKRAGRKDVVYTVAAFICLYFLLVIITAVIATLDGVDLFSSLTASLALVGNIGPGFARVGPVENYAFFSDFSKYWFSFAMIAGRLELYTMLIFFTPAFWKK